MIWRSRQTLITTIAASPTMIMHVESFQKERFCCYLQHRIVSYVTLTDKFQCQSQFFVIYNITRCNQMKTNKLPIISVIGNWDIFLWSHLEIIIQENIFQCEVTILVRGLIRIKTITSALEGLIMHHNYRTRCPATDHVCPDLRYCGYFIFLIHMRCLAYRCQLQMEQRGMCNKQWML